MRILNIKTCVGIGDLIHLKQLLDDSSSKYDKINIALDHDVIKNFKSNYNEYLNFINPLFIKLFSENPYNIVNTVESPLYSPIVYVNHYKQNPEIPNLEKYLCDEQYFSDEIVVLTKIRGFNIKNYNYIKNNFLNLLNILSQKNKITLMGERNIGMNPEYIHHGNESIYSIYTDLINNIKIYKDDTIDELGNTAPEINHFYNDCKKLNAAKYVICLGSGGNVSMAMATSKIINFYGYCEMEPLFKLMKPQENKFITNNLSEFYNKLVAINEIN